jgi:hypothetical protein
MSVLKLRRLRVGAALFGCVIAVSAWTVPGLASASVFANATNTGAYNYTWSGGANSMYTTWTYSWYIELLMQHSGDCDNHKRENFSGTTYVYTPTYSQYCDPRVVRRVRVRALPPASRDERE